VFTALDRVGLAADDELRLAVIFLDKTRFHLHLRRQGEVSGKWRRLRKALSRGANYNEEAHPTAQALSQNAAT
jgi:hypothetical protein